MCWSSICAPRYSTLDADTEGANIPISLTIEKKDQTTDAFRAVHPGTSGELDDDTATDGRYVLHCKQDQGVKTVTMKISRPAALTAFGGEWVQVFPKDSWENTTDEYEPYTFNHYGAKIPLPELRSTPTGLRDEPADTGLEAVDGTGLSRQSADGTETEMGASPAGTTSASADAATTDHVYVYMEVSDDGDYEVPSHLIPCVHLSA